MKVKVELILEFPDSFENFGDGEMRNVIHEGLIRQAKGSHMAHKIKLENNELSDEQKEASGYSWHENWSNALAEEKVNLKFTRISKEDECIGMFMKAVAEDLLSSEKYVQYLREQYAVNPEDDVDIEEEEIAVFLKTDHSSIFVSAGDWAALGIKDNMKLMEDVVGKHAHLLGEDVAQKLKSIEIKAECYPFTEDDRESGLSLEEDYDKIFTYLGNVSKHWLEN